MRALFWIAENRIREAIEAGELDNLPGMGKPLNLDEGQGMDPDTKVAYKLLQNAGYVPLPIMLRKEIERKSHDLDQFWRNCEHTTDQYLKSISTRWFELEDVLGDKGSVTDFLALRRTPPQFPTNLRSEATSVRKRRRKIKSQKLRTDLNRLIQGYNRCIDRFRQDYEMRLTELNKSIVALKMEDAKEEIRKKKITGGNTKLTPLNVARKLRCFEQEFRPFEWSVK